MLDPLRKWNAMNMMDVGLCFGAGRLMAYMNVNHFRLRGGTALNENGLQGDAGWCTKEYQRM